VVVVVVVLVIVSVELVIIHRQLFRARLQSRAFPLQHLLPIHRHAHHTTNIKYTMVFCTLVTRSSQMQH